MNLILLEETGSIQSNCFNFSKSVQDIRLFKLSDYIAHKRKF